MSYSHQRDVGGDGPVHVGGQPDDRRSTDVRVHRDAPPAGEGGDLHAGQQATADAGVGLEHIGRPGPGQRFVLHRGVHALADGHRDRRPRRQPRQLVDAHLRHGLLEEGDRSGANASATASAVRASWNQYESTPISTSGPTC